MTTKKIRFDKLTPYEKGYAVYWFGERKDHPEVPKHYEPKPEERAEYERGQAAACQAAQDAP